MALVLTDDEQMLVDSLRSLLARAAPIAALRALRDAGGLTRHDPGLWRQIADAGFAAPQVPEAEGGLGMGYAAAGLAAQELGRTLAPVPLVSNAVAIELLLAAGDADRRARLLPGLLDGSTVATLALDEGGRHDPDRIATTAVVAGDGWRLNGAKRFVADGGVADLIVVVARGPDDGRLLFLVEPGTAGVEITPIDLFDSRNAADLRLTDVALGGEALLGGGDGDALGRALDVGRVLLAAELLGLAEEAFDRTVAYLKEREQFGAKIGSFQALQHRAARAHVSLELARGVVLKALRALDERDAAATALASLAKAFTARTARDILNEAVQMHGGVGVTDEFDIGLFFKRVRVAGETFGDDYFHKERLARLAWKI